MTDHIAIVLPDWGTPMQGSTTETVPGRNGADHDDAAAARSGHKRTERGSRPETALTPGGIEHLQLPVVYEVQIAAAKTERGDPPDGLEQYPRWFEPGRIQFRQHRPIPVALTEVIHHADQPHTILAERHALPTRKCDEIVNLPVVHSDPPLTRSPWSA
ncbi:hypothetical protein OKHIL_25920 [Mycolicibacterium mageritense]|nr:hypothetical protein MTY414_39850 [Mycolicibacterium mageritense]